MKRETGGPYLSAVFVDYDNIYLSLRRKSEEDSRDPKLIQTVWGGGYRLAADVKRLAPDKS